MPTGSGRYSSSGEARFYGVARGELAEGALDLGKDAIGRHGLGEKDGGAGQKALDAVAGVVVLGGGR